MESAECSTLRTGGGSSEPTKPRRLKGHKGEAICCIASRARPGLIASSGEDGCICWFDLRCKNVLSTMDVGNKPVTSLCFKAGNEDVFYASSGSEVVGFDIHMASSWKRLETYNYNKEEINQIDFSPKSSFLAAADDSGDIKIIDVRQQCLYKTLRAIHTNICSTVQFLSWNPWSVITGGLDSQLVAWDFSKGRSQNILDFGLPSFGTNESISGQCFNPPFVHSIAISEADAVTGLDKVCAVARGDGMVEVIDIESELIHKKSLSSSQHQRGLARTNEKGCINGQRRQRRLQLDYGFGGHTAAVSCVCFSLFGERGKFILSGGADALIKVWDWSKDFHAEQKSLGNYLTSTINLNKKVNWLCTTPTDTGNVIVCDTSKVLKAYTIL
uniref:WD repeat-containing protein 53 n=1 Tax=Anthurium amnicola TaxID=1678845 RepID=A0A1D1XJ43_9ARAE